jgi:penicillin-binding protein-related factor A (putative recombinase)
VNPALPPEFARALRARQSPSLRGSMARKRQKHDGDDCEQVVNGLHEQCRIAGVARMVKLPTPWKIIGKNPRGMGMIAVPEEKSTVDYLGHFIGAERGGAIYVEAKKLTDTSLNFKKRLADHQRTALTNALVEGQTSILLIVHGNLVAPAIYAVPWSEVRLRMNAGEKSLPVAEIGMHRMSRLEPYLARFARGAS